MSKNTTFTQDCVESTDGKGFKCGGCTKIYGTSNATIQTGNTPFLISCKTCNTGFELTASNFSATLTQGTPRMAVAKADLAIYCYETPIIPPWNGTPALIVLIIMGIVTVVSLGVAFFFIFKKKKSPWEPTPEELMNDDNMNGSRMDNFGVTPAIIPHNKVSAYTSSANGYNEMHKGVEGNKDDVMYGYPPEDMKLNNGSSSSKNKASKSIKKKLSSAKKIETGL